MEARKVKRQPTNRRKIHNMAAKKKPAKTKTQVKVKDLKPKKDPKGGAFDAYLKL